MEEEILAAAEVANALEFIQALSDGLETQGEKGGTILSGEQKGCIGIARTILRKAP